MAEVIHLRQHLRADQAFAAYKAMCAAQKRDPALLENPEWAIARDDLHARFERAFSR